MAVRQRTRTLTDAEVNALLSQQQAPAASQTETLGTEEDPQAVLARYRAAHPEDPQARVVQFGEPGYPGSQSRYDEPSRAWVALTDAEIAQKLEQERAREAEIASLQSGPVESFAAGAVEQIPFLDEAAAGVTGLVTGTPYEEVRRLQGDLQTYDRENYGAERNAGGVAGFAAGLAAPGSGYVRAGQGIGQIGRAALVGGAYGGLYGAGAAEDGYANRLRGAAVGAASGAALGGGLQAAGNYAGRLAGIAQTARPSTPFQNRVADFERVGVDPTLAGTGGPVSQRLAQTLSGNLLTGGPIRRAADLAREQTIGAVDDIASRYGSAEGRDTAGRVVRRASEAGAQRFRQEGGQLYTPINQLEQSNLSPIQLSNAATALSEELAVFRTPELRSWFTRNATELSDLEGVINRANAAGGATLAEARRLRTAVGKALDNPETFTSQSEAGLRRMYGALSDDITAGARQLGGEDAVNALSRADTYYSAARTRANDTLKQFYDVQTDAEAYNRLAAAARTSGNRSSWQTLRQLRDSVTPEEWGDIGSGVIRTLGQRGDDFSAAQFATEWEKLTPQARRVLFGGTGREELFSDLSALARVARTQREAGRFYNASESGNTVGNLGVGSAAGGSIVAAASGNPLPLIALVGTGATGNGLSRLLTSPGVARWAAGSARNAVRDGDRLARRNAQFADWWSVSRDAVARSAGQNAGAYQSDRTEE